MNTPREVCTTPPPLNINRGKEEICTITQFRKTRVSHKDEHLEASSSAGDFAKFRVLSCFHCSVNCGVEYGRGAFWCALSKLSPPYQQDCTRPTNKQTNMHEILRQITVRTYIIGSASEPSDILLLRPRRNENKCLFVRVMSMCCNIMCSVIYNKDILLPLLTFLDLRMHPQWHIV